MKGVCAVGSTKRSTYVTNAIKITSRKTRNQLILGRRWRKFHFEPRKYIQSSYHLMQIGVNPSLGFTL